MPKIHFIGPPIDLYRYKTFLETIIDEKEDWGFSINYNAQKDHSRKSNFVKRKIVAICNYLQNLYNIWTADFVYYSNLGIQPSLYHKIIIGYCNLFKKKVIFDFYLSLYDNFVLDRKIVNENSKESFQLKNLDRWGHTRYKTIYLNHCEAKRYRSLNNLNIDSNTLIIPLSISARPFAQLNYFKNGNNRTFNIIWWGTYIPLHGLHKIIEAFKILVSKGANVHLYILGNNIEKSKEFQQKIDNIENLNKHITIYNDKTFSNGKLLPFLIAHCDLALGAFGDSDKAKSVILNKAIEAVAMKIPLLTQFSEAFQEYFDPQTTLFYCDNTAEKISEKIMKIMSIDYRGIENRIEKSYEIYQKDFSVEASKSRYKQLLKLLVSE